MPLLVEDDADIIFSCRTKPARRALEDVEGFFLLREEEDAVVDVSVVAGCELLTGCLFIDGLVFGAGFFG